MLPLRARRKCFINLKAWGEAAEAASKVLEKAPANLKILEMAHKWKMAQKRKAEEISEGDAQEAPES